MSTQTTVAKGQNNRQFVRLPFAGQVQYRYGAVEAGKASCCNIGRDGLGLLMGRYLRPGTLIMLQWSDGRAEFKARVAWCTPTNRADIFLTGLRVLHHEAESVSMMSELLYDAERVNGGIDHLYEERVTPPNAWVHLTPPTPRQETRSWLARMVFAATAVLGIGMAWLGLVHA